KGIGVVGEVADADIRAALEQQPHAVVPVGAGRPMQGRLLLEPAAAGVDQIGMCVEQSAQIIGPASIGGLEDGIDCLPHFRRPPLVVLHVAAEKLDRLVPVSLGDLVDGAAVVVGRAGIEARLEGVADRLGIAGAGGIEDALALASAGSSWSTCALSCRQPAKPYSRASASWTAASLACGLCRRSALSRCLASFLRCSRFARSGNVRVRRADGL